MLLKGKYTKVTKKKQIRGDIFFLSAINKKCEGFFLLVTIKRWKLFYVKMFGRPCDQFS